MILIAILCFVNMVACAPKEVKKPVNVPQASIQQIEQSQQDAWSYFTLTNTYESDKNKFPTMTAQPVYLAARPEVQPDAISGYNLLFSLGHHLATYIPIYHLYDYQSYNDFNRNHLRKSDENNLKSDVGDAKINPIKIVLKPIVKPLLFINRVQLATAMMIKAATLFGG